MINEKVLNQRRRVYKIIIPTGDYQITILNEMIDRHETQQKAPLLLISFLVTIWIGLPILGLMLYPSKLSLDFGVHFFNQSELLARFTACQATLLLTRVFPTSLLYISHDSKEKSGEQNSLFSLVYRFSLVCTFPLVYSFSINVRLYLTEGHDAIVEDD